LPRSVALGPKSLEYFSVLNYSLANEDTAVELSILPRDANCVVCVAGSGARVLPLFAKAPKSLVCVDVSPQQLHLTELRIEAAKTLGLDDYRRFFGYGSQPFSAEERQEVFGRLNLSTDTKISLAELFSRSNWGPIIYLGRWDQAFGKLARFAARVIGPRGLAIFHCRTMDEQRQYLADKFPRWRWRLAVALIGQSYVFNRLIYGNQLPQLNLAKSDYCYFNDRLASTLRVSLARENFFLKILLRGRLENDEALPLECSNLHYSEIQRGIKSCAISYVQSDLYEFLEKNPSIANFVSLSDTPSYSGSATSAPNIMQKLNVGMSTGGLAVARYFRFCPPTTQLDELEDVTIKYEKVISSEITCIYKIGVFQKVEGRTNNRYPC
jgi:S-adenosylmethionine-diacylglycerol 3-amino-3-carboxypropyl transferase